VGYIMYILLAASSFLGVESKCRLTLSSVVNRYIEKILPQIFSMKHN